MKRIITGKRVFNSLVIILCVSIVLYFCFSPDGLVELIQKGKSVSLLWLSGAVFFQLANMFIDSIITKLLIKQNYKNFPFIESVKVALVGHFFSAVTPSSSGGQPMQIYYMNKKGINVGFATSVLIQKFLVFQVVTTLYSIFAVFYKFDAITLLASNPDFKLVTVLIVIGMLIQFTLTGLLILVSVNRSLTHRLVNGFLNLILKIRPLKKKLSNRLDSINSQLDLFHDSNSQLYKNPVLMLKCYILLFVQIVCIFIIPYFIYRSVGMSSESPISIICAQSFVNLSYSIMPLPGASGAAELFFAAFYNQYFLEGTLMTSTLLWRTITYYATIPLTAPFSYLTKDREKDLKIIKEGDGE